MTQMMMVNIHACIFDILDLTGIAVIALLETSNVRHREECVFVGMIYFLCNIYLPLYHYFKSYFNVYVQAQSTTEKNCDNTN